MDLSSQWEVGGEVWVKLELSQAGVGVRVQSGDGWCWFPSRVSIDPIKMISVYSSRGSYIYNAINIY